MNPGFENKVVIVTGGSGGIGQTVVRDFVEEGAKVVVHFHRNRESANELVNEFSNEKVIALGADLRDEQQVKHLFNQASDLWGPPSVLVANAGYWPPDDNPLHEMSLERWQQTIAVDMTSVFLCVREFLKTAIEHNLIDPSIVLIGSTAGWVGEAGHSDYATTKGGLMTGMLQSLKNEIPKSAPRGRVNCVCPGWTLTPMADRLTGNEDSMKRALQTIPLKKFGQPSDVASAVLFFASNRLAGHITGQCLFVSGGMEGRVLNSLDEVDLEYAIGNQTPKI